MVTIQAKELHHPLAEGVKRANLISRPILVSQVLNIGTIDPLSFFALGQAEYTGTRVFWSDPARELVIAGLGSVSTIETEGEQRFEQAGFEWDQLLRDHIRINGSGAAEGAEGTGPVLLGGFSFEPLRQDSGQWKNLGDGRLILPHLMVTQTPNDTWLTLNQRVVPEDDPYEVAEQLRLRVEALFVLPEPDLIGASVYPAATGSCQVVEIQPEKWKEAVARASQEVRAGLLNKVVLARELQVNSAIPFSPEVVLARLREEQPMSYLFAVESSNSCFLGATPERLVKRQRDSLLTACLAGSTGRGATPVEDLQLGKQLLQDSKNRIEHQLVVDMIREAMGEVCTDVVSPAQPVLYKVRDLQHLITPVTGQARPGVSILSVVQKLHPTPALGGFPRAAALERIREYENFQRGWYGAPVGWLDYRGEGEFSVAIRSGLLRGTSASLFAGCGIVGDSDPVSEYEETRLKFKPILSALGVNAR